MNKEFMMQYIRARLVEMGFPRAFAEAFATLGEHTQECQEDIRSLQAQIQNLSNRLERLEDR